MYNLQYVNAKDLVPNWLDAQYLVRDLGWFEWSELRFAMITKAEFVGALNEVNEYFSNEVVISDALQKLPDDTLVNLVRR